MQNKKSKTFIITFILILFLLIVGFLLVRNRGKIFNLGNWNNSEKTFTPLETSLGQEGLGVVGDPSSSSNTISRRWAEAGEDISEGDAVYISGFNANGNPIVKRVVVGDPNKSVVFGIANQNIPIGTMGEITVSGTNLSESINIRMAEAGENLQRGDVVYVSSFNNQGYPIVMKAIANDLTRSIVFGFANEDILKGSLGEIIISGPLSGTDTSNWSIGSQLYLSNLIPGAVTNQFPPSGSFTISVGVVAKIGTTNGVINVGGPGTTISSWTNFAENNISGFIAYGESDVGTGDYNTPSGFLSTLTDTFKSGVNLILNTVGNWGRSIFGGNNDECSNGAINPPMCTIGGDNGNCYDGIQNGDETGIDTGGRCRDSGTGNCYDGIQNGDETGIDTGGRCRDSGTGNCYDGIQNGDETGIDTGGRCEGINNITPLVTVVANPSRINKNESSIISWTSANATRCDAGAGDGFETVDDGEDTTTGFFSTGPLVISKSYTITCFNSGRMGRGTVTVIVNTGIPYPGDPQCSDGIDNDGNNDIDAEDPQCHIGGDLENEYVPIHNSESSNAFGLPQCSDGLDNDLDEFIDFRDPGCHTDFDATNVMTYTTNPAVKENSDEDFEPPYVCPEIPQLTFTEEEKAELAELLRKFYSIAPTLKTTDNISLIYAEIFRNQQLIDNAKSLTKACKLQKENEDYLGPTLIYGNPWFKYDERGSYYEKNKKATYLPGKTSVSYFNFIKNEHLIDFQNLLEKGTINKKGLISNTIKTVIRFGLLRNPISFLFDIGSRFTFSPMFSGGGNGVDDNWDSIASKLGITLHAPYAGESEIDAIKRTLEQLATAAAKQSLEENPELFEFWNFELVFNIW